MSNRIGKLPPRYSYIQNKYQDLRFSKCPRCNHNTWNRKFALFIHIMDLGQVVLGKTCKYCSKCELIIAHEDELEQELANVLSSINPQVIGNEYMVIGTANKNVWKKHLGKKSNLNQHIEHISDFKETLDLQVTPGGWYRPHK